eukprot:scpid34852/ scgid22633/ 
MYKEQIRELSNTTWQNKQVRVYLFGDYEFQCHNYGPSGASGARPCLHCLCLKKSMLVQRSSRAPGDVVPRTLDNLESDLQRYQSAGSKLSQAKNYNNVIRPVILPIPVANAIVPSLHLDLGIFVWLYERLEKELQELGAKLASQSATRNGDRDVFARLSKLHDELRTVQSKLTEAEQQYTTFQHHLQFVATQAGVGDDAAWQPLVQEVEAAFHNVAAQQAQLAKQKNELTEEIKKVSGRKEFCGPCQLSLDPVLQKNGIQRQVYHGGAFNGNHIRVALRPTVVTAITHAAIPIVSERCPNLLPDVTAIAERYSKLLQKYAECSNIFSRNSTVGDDDLSKLDAAVKDFMCMCRTEIVARGYGNITPKLHLLEEHTITLMRTLRVGIGLLGEHGAESIHSALNNLDKSFKNIPVVILSSV